jgi:hypothetical protein
MVPKSRLSSNEGQILLDYGVSDENVDGWLIYEDGDCIRGSTTMDNDALTEYLKSRNFDTNLLEWTDY